MLRTVQQKLVFLNLRRIHQGSVFIWHYVCVSPDYTRLFQNSSDLPILHHIRILLSTMSSLYKFITLYNFNFSDLFEISLCLRQIYIVTHFFHHLFYLSCGGGYVNTYQFLHFVKDKIIPMSIQIHLKLSFWPSYLQFIWSHSVLLLELLPSSLT